MRLTYFTLVASPKIALAMARHESASMPRITPWLSGSEKLAELPITPQTSAPRAFTSVGEVVAGAGVFWARTPSEASAAVSVMKRARASVGRMGLPQVASISSAIAARPRSISSAVL